MKKRIVSFLLALIMALGMLPVTGGVEIAEAAVGSSLAASEVIAKLQNIKDNEYPDGSSYTGSFGGGTECFAFARLLANKVFGSYPWNCDPYSNGQVVNGWTLIRNPSTTTVIEPGDVIEVRNTGRHTAIVWKVSGSSITFAECWGSYGIVNWGAYNDSYSTLASIITAYGQANVNIWKRPGATNSNNPDSGGSTPSSTQPGKPVLKNMKSTYTVGEEIVFKWDATTNTTHYNVWIQRKESDGSWFTVNDPFYKTSGYFMSLGCAEYRVYVDATNSNASDWPYTRSDYVYFTVKPLSTQPGKPVLKDMKSTYTVGEEIVFKWDATTNTTHYNVCIQRKESDGSWFTVNDPFYKTSGYSMSLGSAEYRVYVEAGNSNASDWPYTRSDYVYFTVKPSSTQPGKPALKDMKSTYVSGEEIVFKWDATANTTHYNVWIQRKESDGSWFTVNDPFYKTSGYSMSLGSAEYRVYVDATNSNASDWPYTRSEYVYFTVNLPAPILSISTKVDGTPRLSWASVDGAKKYEVYRATSSNGTYTKLTSTTSCTYTDSNLTNGTTYFYKVRAVADNNYSQYSTVKSHTYMARYTVSGSVTSFLDDEGAIAVELYTEGSTKAKYSVVVTGNTAEYSLMYVEPGTYTMKVRKKDHATREYRFVVSNNVTLFAEIFPKGDTDFDGDVNADDLTVLARHVAKIEQLTNAYGSVCADVDGNGSLSADDLTMLARYVAKIIPSLDDSPCIKHKWVCSGYDGNTGTITQYTCSVCKTVGTVIATPSLAPADAEVEQLGNRTYVFFYSKK